MFRNVIMLGALAVVGCSEPVAQLDALNGCYEGKGSPDFMRPPVHWTFRVSNGLISDRSGQPVSRIRLKKSASDATLFAFSPGIRIAGTERKETTVVAGDTVSGTAYLAGSRAIILLGDHMGTVMQKTSCGPTAPDA